MTSYFGAFIPGISVSHQVWVESTTQTDIHGNAETSYAPAVTRKIMTIYPLHKLPHHDIVDSDYVGRSLIDYIMEVPDATVYSKNDIVTPKSGDLKGMEFLVQGFPMNWGGNDPFGMDKTMFGGSVHIERVT